ncbi:hypothetical protein MBLNU230_g0602t1 [Neophaeotheca triangularis]
MSLFEICPLSSENFDEQCPYCDDTETGKKKGDVKRCRNLRYCDGPGKDRARAKVLARKIRQDLLEKWCLFPDDERLELSGQLASWSLCNRHRRDQAVVEECVRVWAEQRDRERASVGAWREFQTPTSAIGYGRAGLRSGLNIGDVLRPTGTFSNPGASERVPTRLWSCPDDHTGAYDSSPSNASSHLIHRYGNHSFQPGRSAQAVAVQEAESTPPRHERATTHTCPPNFDTPNFPVDCGSPSFQVQDDAMIPALDTITIESLLAQLSLERAKSEVLETTNKDLEARMQSMYAEGTRINIALEGYQKRDCSVRRARGQGMLGAGREASETFEIAD